jgi:hypothetical protein
MAAKNTNLGSWAADCTAYRVLKQIRTIQIFRSCKPEKRNKILIQNKSALPQQHMIIIDATITFALSLNSGAHVINPNS